MTTTLFDISGADISPCRHYRYALWRHWDWQGHANCVLFIGLNPSTADEEVDDMTVRKCIGFAKRWGYGGAYMLNLYAFRATNPEVMAAQDNPDGVRNLEAFGCYRTRVGLIVAAWGSLAVRYRPRLRWKSRIDEVLHAIGRPVKCLGFTQDREPKHPSRLAYATPLETYWEPTE